jgi:3-dehydroquinate dehydratase-1
MRQTDVKLIISFHDFDETPSFTKMCKILEEEAAIGADICKIVTTAKRIEDNLSILNFLSKTCGNHKTVSFCMGEEGKPSRFLSPLFGAYFTIASLHPRGETAPGQLPIREMRKAYDALELM